MDFKAASESLDGGVQGRGRSPGTLTPMPSWRQRESEKQLCTRNTNESTARLFATTRPGDGVGSFACECGDRACACAISLTLAEYESVREYATHFAIARDHENPESERVITETERFAVIETLSPEATKLARRSDPRWGREHAPFSAGEGFRRRHQRGRDVAVDPVAPRTVRQLTNDGGPQDGDRKPRHSKSKP
jgi:hypothetical protein